tara:strand:- start:2696 stop:4969 length:2274 start_codon:yes stop_codon:yes gene_type:complete
MARRPEDSIESIGESLLSQQADRRKRAEKRRRRDQKKLMLMGTLVAGQSLVNSALKRRAKEIADLGEMSKFKSKAQAENMAFYAPIFQSMEGAETFEDWKKTVGTDSAKYRALQGHLSPLLIANAKQQIGPEAADPIIFNREYAALKDTITNNLIEQAYGKDAQGRSYKDLFSLGAEKFAKSTGVDPVSKDALFEFLSNTTQNSVDAYKAQELNRRNGNFSTSVFSKDVVDTALNAFSFGLIKREKGESNPFKSISSRESLLPTELQTVFDGYNVNQIIKKEFASNYATMRDEVEAFANNKDAVTSMTDVWNKTVDRVKRGTWFDFHRLPLTEREGGHRYTVHSEAMIDNVYEFVEDRQPVREELLNQAGALANMLGDPNRPKMKETIMDQWLLLPPVQELGITKGDQEYRQVLSSLDTLKGRQEFAIDFVTGLSIKNNKVFGFEVDFSEVKSITEPKFEVVKEGNITKFAPTEIYNISSSADKVLHYNSYLNAILTNQTRSKNTPEQLRQVALQFMQDIPPPDGRTPEEVLNSILDPIVEREERKRNVITPSVLPIDYSFRLNEEKKKLIEVDTMKPLAVGEDVTHKAIDQIVKNRSGNVENNRQFFREVAVAESANGTNKDTFNNTRDAIGIFQIIPSQSLTEIKRRLDPNADVGAPLRRYNQQLINEFGIDLRNVTEEDLKIPLVNTAVMSAYFATVPTAIPTDPIEKAIYYVDNYVKYDPKSETYQEDRNKSIKNYLQNNNYFKELIQFNTSK